ncbi:MAG: hypothetical protein GXO89_10890, partial [Chlorobi bacterium]|nr:hypothetical protein [Chlorobiota bacterium]
MLLISLNGLQVFKLLQILVLSGVKFIFAPLISIGYGFNYFQTVIITTIGGIFGFLFFYYLSRWIIQQYNRLCPIVFSYFTGNTIERAKQILNCGETKKKKAFSRRNRKIVSIRKKYGFAGIVLLTPVLLSIPIGAFLAQKYYSKRSNVLVYLSL